jgi:hypothetical protein
MTEGDPVTRVAFEEATFVRGGRTFQCAPIETLLERGPHEDSCRR